MSELTSIKQILTALKPELRRKYHVASLGLFGSVVRGDFGPESDVDILVDFTKPIGIEFIDLADRLESVLKKKVDLVSKKGVKPTYLKYIESDIVYV
jgi:predicted nucleotidyltransferase